MCMSRGAGIVHRWRIEIINVFFSSRGFETPDFLLVKSILLKTKHFLTAFVAEILKLDQNHDF